MQVQVEMVMKIVIIHLDPTEYDIYSSHVYFLSCFSGRRTRRKRKRKKERTKKEKKEKKERKKREKKYLKKIP